MSNPYDPIGTPVVGRQKRALIITWSGFQDQEVVYPYYRLLGAEFEVHIAADQRDTKGRVYGILGVNMPIHLDVRAIKWTIGANECDLLVLPGGVKALEKLRQEQGVLDFIAEFYATGKTIASTCHGAQLLISAKVCKGHTIAAYPSIKDDIENAGATYSGEPVVVSGNIISSPHYDHMGPWMEAAIARVNGH